MIDGGKRRQGYYAGNSTLPAVYTLRRAVDKDGCDKPGSYVVVDPITYVDQGGREWTIPRRSDVPFETDLASIPAFATWLVPKDGSHTPGALIHDAMVLKDQEEPNYAPPVPRIGAEEADRIFRQAMQHLGVRLIRRWLMWTAVSIRSFWVAPGKFWVRRAMLFPLAWFLYFGVVAIPDVLDVPGRWSPEIVCFQPTFEWQAPGISEQAFGGEVRSYLAITAAGSLAYALLWMGPRWKFGLIAGLALPLIAFPMAIPLLAFGLYALAEEGIAFVLRLRQNGGVDTGRVRSSVVVARAADRLRPPEGDPPGPPP